MPFSRRPRMPRCSASCWAPIRSRLPRTTASCSVQPMPAYAYSRRSISIRHSKTGWNACPRTARMRLSPRSGAPVMRASSPSTMPNLSKTITPAPRAARSRASRLTSASSSSWTKGPLRSGMPISRMSTRSSFPAMPRRSHRIVRKPASTRPFAPARACSVICPWPSASWSPSFSWARWGRLWARR